MIALFSLIRGGGNFLQFFKKSETSWVQESWKKLKRQKIEQKSNKIKADFNGKLCKIYAKKRQNYVKRDVAVRFVTGAVPEISKVLWRNGRRGDKQTGGQQFESHRQLEVNSSSGSFDFL